MVKLKAICRDSNDYKRRTNTEIEKLNKYKLSFKKNFILKPKKCPHRPRKSSKINLSFGTT